MDKKIRVAHVLRSMDMGGIETFIMNLLKNKQEKNIEYSFIFFTDKDCFFKSEIASLNCKIFYATSLKNPIKHVKEMVKILKNEKIDVVHAHSSFYNFVILFSAKIAGVKSRISHAHGTADHKKVTIQRALYTSFSRFFIKRFANVFCACSKEAGQFLYGKSLKNLYIIENGIDIDKFRYDEKARNELRNKLEISSKKMIIGHVGRFSPEKNHEFIIDIFLKLNEVNSNIELWLIGEGELQNVIKNKVKVKNISSKVKFWGNIKDVEKYLSAMDVFVFPSIHEGLGISLIEAQCSGLKCVVSNNISKLAIINSNVISLGLNQEEIWISEILDSSSRIKNIEYEKFKNFDIKNSTRKMENIYIKSIK